MTGNSTPLSLETTQKKSLLFTLKFHMIDKYSSGSKNVLGLYIILISIILVQKANEQTYKQTTKQGS